MYSYLNWTQQIAIISEYISHNIEKKLFQLNFNNPKSRLRKKLSKRNELLLTPLSWESYMKADVRANDIPGFLLMFVLFSMITILSIFAGIIILYFDYSQESQAKGFEEAIKTVLSILYTLPIGFPKYLTNSFCLVILIILIINIRILLVYIYRNFKKILDLVIHDWNWLWVFALIFITYFHIHVFLSHDILLEIMVKNTTYQNITVKDYLLFLLPVTIWIWCLFKISHQIIYTWRIRDISQKTLSRQEYLEQLWN